MIRQLVKQVQLQSVDAPAQVLSAYRDVTAAQQDQQRAVNEAETYAIRSRYNQIYDQYKKAPGACPRPKAAPRGGGARDEDTVELPVFCYGSSDQGMADLFKIRVGGQ